MTYDLIIVSRSSHPELIRNTQHAIDTCLADTKKVNVILIETYKKHYYRGVNEMIFYTDDFIYNHALNLGLEHRKNEIQILANNDIIFQKGWSKIGNIMRANNYLSASALSGDLRQRWFQRGDWAYEGYLIGFQLSGWCIFCDHKLWDKIGKLDEIYKFWFSDNAYAEQLKRAKIKHALICSVFVDHLGSRTLNKCDSQTRMLYTHSSRKKIRHATRKRIIKADTKDL